ncbi:unnamed protein product [Rotaria sordida]|uniref:Transmembrane protein n=1 Tax=Rotaria sordida TaxID=392033 RepID=A0A814A0K2_9BILA|nr:unnamed protein product [Rotaria sordida]
MQYKQGNEKVYMMDGYNQPLSKLFPFNQDPEIQRTRKILLIILGVCLGILLSGMINVIFGPTIDICLIGNGHIAEIIEYLISIILYTFGLFVVYRYSEIGLRVFAWLNIITLIIVGIVILALFIIGMTNSNDINLSTLYGENPTRIIKTQKGPFFCAFLYIPDCILTIIIVKFAFKLAKIINHKKSLPIQQV